MGVILLDKAAILAAQDLPFEDVAVKEWGGSVRIRTMSGKERDEFRAAVAEEAGMKIGAFSAALLATTIVDEAGNRLFSVEDVEALRGKSSKALDALAAVAMRLNGLGPTSHEDAVKNSEGDRSADSGSGSPKNLAKA